MFILIFDDGCFKKDVIIEVFFLEYFLVVDVKIENDVFWGVGRVKNVGIMLFFF